jgi:hypothetical protein
MSERAKSSHRVEGGRPAAPGVIQAVRRRWGPAVLAGLLAALVAAATGCEPPDPYRTAAHRARKKTEYARAHGVPLEIEAQSLPADTSDDPDEADIPLPPGWADEVAQLRRRQAAAGKPRPEPIEYSPDGIDLDRLRPEDHRAEASFGGYGSDGNSLADPGGGPVSLGNRLGGSASATPRRPAGDFTAMAVVFLVPVAIVIPLAWIWHVVRTLRQSAEQGMMPVAPGRTD